VKGGVVDPFEDVYVNYTVLSKRSANFLQGVLSSKKFLRACANLLVLE
jgi:hypothetical protein